MKKRDYRKVKELRDLLDTAWTVIANAGGGDLTKEAVEWRDAAAKWRGRYHAAIKVKLD